MARRRRKEERLSFCAHTYFLYECVCVWRVRLVVSSRYFFFLVSLSLWREMLARCTGDIFFLFAFLSRSGSSKEADREREGGEKKKNEEEESLAYLCRARLDVVVEGEFRVGTRAFFSRCSLSLFWRFLASHSFIEERHMSLLLLSHLSISISSHSQPLSLRCLGLSSRKMPRDARLDTSAVCSKPCFLIDISISFISSIRAERRVESDHLVSICQRTHQRCWTMDCHFVCVLSTRWETYIDEQRKLHQLRKLDFNEQRSSLNAKHNRLHFFGWVTHTHTKMKNGKHCCWARTRLE